MTDPIPPQQADSERRFRRRMLNLGEAIAIAALVISALGLWNQWQGRDDSKAKPATVVEQKVAVPLALRGKIEDGGKALTIAPVDPGHALDSLTLTIAGKAPIELGSDGNLSASAVQSAVEPPAKDKRTGVVPVAISARYIELGKDRRGGGTYRLSYRWESGGLFGGRSLRLTGFSRS
ncbi:MAG: hypothetical protein M3N06_02995 [Pseudomonadota bacterium]|jgi:hypothetical protein|nr:hypothetical protein [Pseudomonadota bacterium]